MNKKLAIMTAALCVAAMGTVANAEESKGRALSESEPTGAA